MIDWRGDELAELFEYLPEVLFYSKDAEGRFIRCNEEFEKWHGVGSGDTIGKTDFDFHEPEIAGGYRAEDLRVMELGRALPRQLWLVPSADGVCVWWISSKIPVRDSSGSVIGIAGAMYRVGDQVAGITGPHARIEAALKLMHEKYSCTLAVDELAKACNLSVSQFNRVFRNMMRQSPKVYIQGLRLGEAKRLLVESSLTLTEVALQAGFYDGSDFGKHFRKTEGMSPRAYRMKLRNMISVGGK